MGWTSQHRPRGTSHREFFGDLIGPKHEIVECATVRGAFYAAVRNTTTDEVYALVCLVSWSPKSAYNFSYKEMDESCGPCYYDAPARVLDLLTPTQNKYALEWRTKCREQLAKAAQVPRVKIGDTIELAQPVTFRNGDVVDTLTMVGRGRFKDTTTGRHYLLGDYRRRKFRLVGAEM